MRPWCQAITGHSLDHVRWFRVRIDAWRMYVSRVAHSLAKLDRGEKEGESQISLKTNWAGRARQADQILALF